MDLLFLPSLDQLAHLLCLLWLGLCFLLHMMLLFHILLLGFVLCRILFCNPLLHLLLYLLGYYFRVRLFIATADRITIITIITIRAISVIPLFASFIYFLVTFVHFALPLSFDVFSYMINLNCTLEYMLIVVKDFGSSF